MTKKEQKLIEKQNKILLKEQKLKQKLELQLIAKKDKEKKLLEKSQKEKHKFEIEQAKKIALESVLKIKYKRAFEELLGEIKSIQNRYIEGEEEQYIVHSLYNIRNSPFELTQSKKYCIFPDIKPDKTIEHINGRTNIGVYAIYCILNKSIRNWVDLKKWYEKYSTWVYTSSSFNQLIKVFQNKEGAIDSEIYIKEYENALNIKLSKEQIEKFKSHFLYDTYGTITKQDILRIIKFNINVING